MSNNESKLSYTILKKQDSTSTNAIISHLVNNSSFQKLSEYEGLLISNRDKEDDIKLQAGIDHAISEGVLENITPDPYKDVYVDGKTPLEVSQEMLAGLGEDWTNSSFAIVLCGFSGTGKGTTVSCLKNILQSEYSRNVCCWSNGNIFRSISLLALTYCQNNDIKEVSDALTTDNIASWMSMLQFCKSDEEWDTMISGMGLNYAVQSIQNTLLKSSDISKVLPTVAKTTQGQVIMYASSAISKMIADTKDLVVLLEGRQQTVNYVASPYRFVLKLKDQDVVGQRRAAQRIMAGVLACVDKDEKEVNDEKVAELVLAQLAKLVEEVP